MWQEERCIGCSSCDVILSHVLFIHAISIPRYALVHRAVKTYRRQMCFIHSAFPRQVTYVSYCAMTAVPIRRLPTCHGRRTSAPPISWCPHMYGPPNTVKARRQKFCGRRTTVVEQSAGWTATANICLTEFRRLLKTFCVCWDSAHCDFFVLMASSISILTYLLIYLLIFLGINYTNSCFFCTRLH